MSEPAGPVVWSTQLTGLALSDSARNLRKSNEKSQIPLATRADAAPLHAALPDLDACTADLLGCAHIKERLQSRNALELQLCRKVTQECVRPDNGRASVRRSSARRPQLFQPSPPCSRHARHASPPTPTDSHQPSTLTHHARTCCAVGSEAAVKACERARQQAAGQRAFAGLVLRQPRLAAAAARGRAGGARSSTSPTA